MVAQAILGAGCGTPVHPVDRLPQGLVARHGRPAGAPVSARRQDRSRSRQVQGQAQGRHRADGPGARLAARFEPLATRLYRRRSAQAGRRARTDPPRFGRPPTTPAPTNGDGQPAPTVAAAAGGAGEWLRTRGSDRHRAGEPSQPRPGSRQGGKPEFARRKLRFLVEEGAAFLVDPSVQGDGGTLFVASASMPDSPRFGPGAQGRDRTGGYSARSGTRTRPDPPADRRRQRALQPHGPDDRARASRSRWRSTSPSSSTTTT